MKSPLQQAQEAYMKALIDAGKSGAEIPEDVAKNHDVLSKALGAPDDAPPEDPNAAEIARLQAEIARLQATPAPPRSRQTLESNPGAAVKPVTTTDASGLLSKAIEISGDPIQAQKLGFEIDDLPHQYDLMKMITAKSNGVIKIKDGLQISPHGQAYLQSITQLHQDGKIRL